MAWTGSLTPNCVTVHYHFCKKYYPTKNVIKRVITILYYLVKLSHYCVLLHFRSGFDQATCNFYYNFRRYYIFSKLLSYKLTMCFSGDRVTFSDIGKWEFSTLELRTALWHKSSLFDLVYNLMWMWNALTTHWTAVCVKCSYSSYLKKKTNSSVSVFRSSFVGYLSLSLLFFLFFLHIVWK